MRLGSSLGAPPGTPRTSGRSPHSPCGQLLKANPTSPMSLLWLARTCCASLRRGEIFYFFLVTGVAITLDWPGETVPRKRDSADASKAG